MHERERKKQEMGGGSSIKPFSLFVNRNTLCIAQKKKTPDIHMLD